VAKALLQITDHASGDNYSVTVHPLSDPTPVNDQTGNIVAWKRVYIENDKMYKVGSDLSADFTPDYDGNPPNPQPDTLTLTSASWCTVGDSIRVFDADHPDGEPATIQAINGNSILLNVDLQNSYDAGYNPGRGAAVGKPSGLYYEADLSRLTNAFGSDIEGTDGGCFAEFLSLSDGAGPVPHKQFLGNLSSPTMPEFSDVWFLHSVNMSNYIHAIGAERCQYVGDDIFGMTYSGANCQCTYVDSLGVLALNSDTTAHEMGHQFVLGSVDNNHPANVWCHQGSGTDYCLMSYQRTRTDSYSEFCKDSPDHVVEVRSVLDGL